MDANIEQNVKPKKKFPKFIIPLIIAVLVVAGVAAGLISHAYSDEKRIEHAVSDFVEGLKDYPIVGSLYEAFTTSHATLKIEDGDNYAKVDLWSDLENKKYAGSIAVDYNKDGIDVERTSALWFSEKYIIVDDSQGMLGDVFGVSRDNLLKKFQDSVFYPGSGSKYSLDVNDEMLENIEKILKDIEDGKSEKVVKESKEYLEKYFKKLSKLIKKYCETSSENAEGGHTIKIKIDDKQMLQIAIDLLEAARKDKSLIKFLNENYNYRFLSEGFQSYVVYDDYDAEEADKIFYSNFDNVDADFSDIFADLIEDLEEELENYDDRSADYGKNTIEIEIVTAPVSRKLRSLNIKTVDKSRRRTITNALEINASDKDVLELTVKESVKYDFNAIIEDDDDPDWYEDRNSAEKYTLKKTDDGYAFTYKRTYNGNSEEVFSLKLKYKDGNKYTLTYEDDYEKVTFSGKLIEKRKSFFISVTSVKYENGDDETQELEFNISLSIERDKKLPALPSYVDVLTLEEADLDDIGNQIGNYESTGYIEIIERLICDKAGLDYETEFGRHYEYEEPVYGY